MKKQETDSTETRSRLLEAGLDVFAESGFSKASTREICRRAGANMAAIHYHFGDKAGLYREIFSKPFRNGWEKILEQAEFKMLPREEALAVIYRNLLEPLKADPRQMQLMRLHMLREMVQPSGVLDHDARLQTMHRRHALITDWLCQQVGASAVDQEISRLTFSMVGMGAIYFFAQDLVIAETPSLLHGEHWQETLVRRLVFFASALIDAEKNARRLAGAEAQAAGSVACATPAAGPNHNIE